MRVEREREKERMRGKHLVEGRGPLAVWTTGVWEKEAMGMRWAEKKVVQAVEKWSTPREGETPDTSRFVRRVKLEESKPSILARVWWSLTKA